MSAPARHGVCAITKVTLCPLLTERFRLLFEQQADLTRGLVQTLLVDEQRCERRLLLLGQQRSVQRVCFLMLELRDRLIARGLATEASCHFPLTYEQMMDALGLSRSQLARSLSEIRDRGWATLAHAQLSFCDAAAMAAFCDYEAEAPHLRRTLI